MLSVFIFVDTMYSSNTLTASTLLDMKPIL